VSQTTTNNCHLIIQANSPGELIAWVQPLAKRMKELNPDVFITLALVPCQYATKREALVASSFQDIDEIYDVKTTLKTLFSLKPFPKRSKQGAVMYCGGDPFYSQLISLKTGFSAYGYTEHRRALGWRFKRTFFKHLDGDLMTTRIRDFNQSRTECLAKLLLDDKEYLLIQPASRPQYFNLLIPYFSQLTQTIHHLRPDIPMLLSLSPFSTNNDYSELNTNLTPFNCHVVQGHSLEAMAVSKLMVSIPGTNTAEAMYMRLPMLTIFPAQFSQLAPIDGLLGLFKYIPVLGELMHKYIVSLLLKKVRFISLPNIMSQEIIAPQLIKNLPVTELADSIIKLYDDKKELERIKNKLENFSVESQIDTIICETILNKTKSPDLQE
jgi:lipid-A-disaccharide synthase